MLGLINFNGFVSSPPDLMPTLMQLDIIGALDVAMISVIISFLFVNLFDTAGTLLGVASRANLINESGKIKNLDKALKEDLIFGAGIDVFKQEPPENDNPLLKNDKVYLSPHTAAFTDECMTRMGVETIQNIIDYFDDTLEKSKIVRL